MNYLLDTHVTIWSLVEVNKIPPHIVKILQESQNKIYVSVVSFWEISIKYSIGKIELENVKPEDFPVLVEKSKFEILPVNPSEVASSYKLPWIKEHKDPFDRMLIWQAIQRNITVISKDADFKLYTTSGLNLLW